MTDLAAQIIDEEEGPSASHVYLVDGVMHIARACVVDPHVPSDGLCQAARDAQDAYDLAQAKERAADLPGFQRASEIRQAVLVSMCYQLGTLDEWPKFKGALALGDYAMAADEMLASQWAHETPNRAKREAAMMRLNVWFEKGSDFGE